MTLTEYYNNVQYLWHTMQGEVACYHAAPVQFEVAALLPESYFRRNTNDGYLLRVESKIWPQTQTGRSTMKGSRLLALHGAQ